MADRWRGVNVGVDVKLFLREPLGSSGGSALLSMVRPAGRGRRRILFSAIHSASPLRQFQRRSAGISKNFFFVIFLLICVF